MGSGEQHTQMRTLDTFLEYTKKYWRIMACCIHYLSSPEIGRRQFNKGVSFIFIFTNPFSCYLALSVYVCVRVCVCVWLIHLHYFCQFSLCYLVRTYTYTCEFWKGIIFAKKGIIDRLCKVYFWYQWVIYLM